LDLPLHPLGFVDEVLVLTFICSVMPVTRPSLGHALLGALSAAMPWGILRDVFLWCFATLSQIRIVHGSLTSTNQPTRRLGAFSSSHERTSLRHACALLSAWP
jgi:hypothetical protein